MNAPPTPPGWYPDPQGQGQRWWDGHDWTSQLLVDDDAPQIDPEYPAKLRKWKRARIIRWSVIVGIPLLLIIGTGSYFNRSSSEHTVVFEVEGGAPGVDLTIQAGEDQTQVTDKAVPLRINGKPGLRVKAHSGAFLYIAAQNVGGSGTVTCRITVDGRIISENTSSGGYVIATCDGKA